MKENNYINLGKNLIIGDLKIPVPIVQGGMGVGISLSNLASAVANHGGIGVISSVGIGINEPDYINKFVESNVKALKEEIRKTREKTNGIIGVNIMVAQTDYNELVKAAIEEGIDIIFSGAGLPLKLPEMKTTGSKTKLVPIVSGAKALSLIIRFWEKRYNYLPDAVVVEGPLAGGHLGFKYENINNPDFCLENLIKEVIELLEQYKDKKNIPIIAGGGIYSGADIKKFFDLGADAVQMATRFVTTNECDAADEFKQLYINCNKDDIIIINSPVGLPGRAIQNQFLKDVNHGLKKPFICPYHCLKTCDYKNVSYCIAFALTSAKKGRFNTGFAFAGANAYKTNKIISVEELLNTLYKEFTQA